MLTVPRFLTRGVSWGLGSFTRSDGCVSTRTHISEVLRFIFYGRHFEWMVLPFALSVASWLFTSITAPVCCYLRWSSRCYRMSVNPRVLFRHFSGLHERWSRPSHDSRSFPTSRLDFFISTLKKNGFSSMSTEAILRAHRPSNTAYYNVRWLCFQRWFRRLTLRPQSVPVQKLAEFLLYI